MGADTADKKGFVTLTKMPRPDHPSERQPICLRVDLIGMIVVDNYDYKPDDKAPVALLPNAKILHGEGTFVHTMTGASFMVQESPDQILDLIEQAKKGDTKKTGYTVAMPAFFPKPN